LRGKGEGRGRGGEGRGGKGRRRARERNFIPHPQFLDPPLKETTVSISLSNTHSIGCMQLI